jgi:hypothetical protein
MAGAERGAPQANALGIELGSCADEGQCGIDVLEVAAHAHQLARLAARFAEMAEVEGQHREARGRKPELLIAFRTVSGFVMGLAQAQLAGPLSTGTDPDIARAQALSPERYPRLIEIAKAATRLGADREFRAGLDIVMAGLASPR